MVGDNMSNNLVWEHVKPTLKGIQNAPNTIGVYVFWHKDEILYIGKSVNLKARLLSHKNAAKLDEREGLIVEGSDKIEFTVTDSEFKALLLESKLIQRYLPKYNRLWKDDKSYLYIKVPMKDDFPLIHPVRRERKPHSLYFGPFPSVKIVEEILRAIRRVIPFCRQKTIGRYRCFYSKLGLCEPCPSYVNRLTDEKEKMRLKRAYRRNIRKVIQILEGNTDAVLEHLYRELSLLSKAQQYERALKLRNKIYRFEQFVKERSFSKTQPLEYNRSQKSLDSLQELLKTHFPKLNSLHRIECYDVSNLSQKEATASMVVLVDGLVDKGQYRRFKIKNLNARSDFEMLKETMRRRLNQNWDLPDLIVIDGGKPQLKMIRRVLSEENIDIPLIGIAKNPDRLIIPESDMQALRPAYDHLGLNLIRQIRDESHRFARNYHLLLRKKSLKI